MAMCVSQNRRWPEFWSFFASFKWKRKRPGINSLWIPYFYQTSNMTILLEMLFFKESHPNEFITFLWNEKCWVSNFLRRPVFVTIQSKLVVGTSSSTSFFFFFAVQRHFTPIRCPANCLQLMDCKISKTVFYKTFHTISVWGIFRPFWPKSAIPHPLLSKIWDLSDRKQIGEQSL